MPLIACRLSYLPSSLTDPKECRQSMASMVLEGMYIVSKCLSKFSGDGLNGYSVWLAKFYLFVCTCILGTRIVVQWNCGCYLCLAYPSLRKQRTSLHTYIYDDGL